MYKKSNPIIKCLFLSVLLFLVSIVIIKKSKIDNINILVTIQHLILLSPIFLLGYKKLVYIGLKRTIKISHVIRKVCKYYLIFILTMIAIHGASVLAGSEIPFFGQQTIPQNFVLSQSKITIILWICIVGPIIEELYFRNFILENIKSKKYANIIQAGIFGLFHMELSILGPITIYGYLLGKLKLKYGIKYAIWLHIINNSISVVALLYLQNNMI